MSRDDEEFSHAESDSDPVINDAIPFVSLPVQGAKVGIKPTIYGVSQPERNVRLVTPGMEDYLSDEKRSLGGFNVTFRENLSVGRTDFQILQWLRSSDSHRRSDPWRVYYCPAPIISSPQNNAVVPPNAVFAGSGAASGASVRVSENVDNGKVYGSNNAGPNGQWQVNVNNLPNRQINLKVDYVVEGVESDKSLITVNVASAPIIKSPESGDVVSDLRPEVSGTGSNGTTIRIFRQDGVGGAYGSAQVSNGSWKAKLTQDLPEGPFVFHAEARLGGQLVGWSNEVPVTVRHPALAPVITDPPADSTQDRSFTLAGTEGKAGATMRVFVDPMQTNVGEASVTGADWSVPVTVEPGMRSLVAQQTLNGLPSERSVPRPFKIRPAVFPKVDVTFVSETTVKFSGTGFSTARVVITVLSGPGGTAPPVVTVEDGKWETTATNWLFGTYHLSAIQKVSDNANGWIESPPYTFSVNRVLPDPSDVTYTKVYQPTFSGKGYTGATVKLFNADRLTPVAPEVRVFNGQWSSRASEEWGPVSNRIVHIKQHLNDQQSPNWVVLKVTIPPLAPVINEPVENGLSPDLSGTCRPDAVLKLIYSDSPTEHPVTNNNGTWQFRRDLPFEPDKTHTATITQTAAGQTSPPASRTFVVYAPIPRPVITDPESDSEVGRDVTIRGQDGMAGATMQLRDAQFGRDLGQPQLLNADGEWSIDLKTLDYRPYTIDAQQTLNGRASERSEPCNFRVALMPPVFTEPMSNGDMPRNSTIKGWGTPLARVTVWLEGTDEPVAKDILVGGEGRWKTDVALSVGARVIYGRQTLDGRTSKDSLPVNFKVVPAAPFMETPAEGEPIGRQTVVSGFGVAGDTVTVRLSNPPFTVLGQTRVQEDRTWSMKVTLDQPGGPRSLVAMATCDGFESADSAERVVELGTYQPSIDVPKPGDGVNNPVPFEGQGRPGIGQVVSWFNPDQVWARDLAVETGGWQGEATQSMPTGGNWCRFKQTITDDGATVSDWVESKRFEILPPST